MSTPTIPVLVDTLRRHGLLEPDQLADVEGSPFADAKALLKELLKRGWLTRFQAQMLLEGRGQELILGSHVLLEALGEGGMGQVYKARHRHLRRVVAIKQMRAEFLSNEKALKRFQREVRAVAQLQHPNIVRAFDADQVNGKHFLVMEFVEGIDLARMVQEQGPLPIATAVEYIGQTARGLQHAFERGLVHRDIKPSNMLVTPQGQIKILDLGLARFESGSDSLSAGLTHQGTVLGTVDFIAPEQATDSSSADIRADLYSLGCTFYFLLTGQVPFPGGEVLGKVLKHRLENPTPVEMIRPEVPERIITIIRTLMAKKPEERYATPADLAAVLSGEHGADIGTTADSGIELQALERGEAKRLAAAAGSTPFAHLDSMSPEKETEAPGRHFSWSFLAGILAIPLCLAILAYLVHGWLNGPSAGKGPKSGPVKKSPTGK